MNIDAGEIQQLFSERAQAALQNLPAYRQADSLKLIASLRKAGFSNAESSALVNQAKLCGIAVEKFGAKANEMLFTRAGLEQATRLEIARLRAEYFRAAGAKVVADLGCGVGADALAKAETGIKVVGVEKDPLTAAIAGFNLRNYPNARVQVGLAEEFDLSSVDSLFFDPARRTDSVVEKRVHDPNLASPSLDFILEAAKKVELTAAKLAPAIAHEYLPASSHTQWLSFNGTLVEASLYLGAFTEFFATHRSAKVLLSSPTLRSFTLEPDGTDPDYLRTPETGALEQYLIEADPAVLRAGLLGTLARQINANLIDPAIAYLSATDLAAYFQGELQYFAKAFKILEVQAFNVKQLAARLKQLEITELEIKKRGVEVDPSELRKKLKLPKSGASKAAKRQLTLVLTRIGDKHLALICERVRN